ncbi:hypothetical protein GPZ77_33360 [Streptomyces sp. QHH-9511]|nr:hypothetical protein GPZ77_33360 [Streptomyces sp. QHH-9511]
MGLRINEARMLDLDDVRWELGRFGKLNGRNYRPCWAGTARQCRGRCAQQSRRAPPAAAKSPI